MGETKKGSPDLEDGPKSVDTTSHDNQPKTLGELIDFNSLHETTKKLCSPEKMTKEEIQHAVRVGRDFVSTIRQGITEANPDFEEPEWVPKSEYPPELEAQIIKALAQGNSTRHEELLREFYARPDFKQIDKRYYKEAKEKNYVTDFRVFGEGAIFPFIRNLLMTFSGGKTFQDLAVRAKENLKDLKEIELAYDYMEEHYLKE